MDLEKRHAGVEHGGVELGVERSWTSREGQNHRLIAIEILMFPSGWVQSSGQWLPDLDPQKKVSWGVAEGVCSSLELELQTAAAFLPRVPKFSYLPEPP